MRWRIEGGMQTGLGWEREGRGGRREGGLGTAGKMAGGCSAAWGDRSSARKGPPGITYSHF